MSERSASELKNCQWICRFAANPGDAEGRRPAAHPGLGTWVGAQVASPRCPILRPGVLRVSGRAGIGQMPSSWSGLDTGSGLAPAAPAVRPRGPVRPLGWSARALCGSGSLRRLSAEAADSAPAAEPVRGFLPSRARSSRLRDGSSGPGARGSGTAFLQQVIDEEALLNQSQAAPQGMSRLLGREALKSTVADAIVLAEVAVDGIQAMVGLTSDDVGLLPFGVALPTNDALMSESCSHIME